MDITTYSTVLLSLIGTGFTFLFTVAGSAMVFFFRKNISGQVHRLMLGFASGVMMAASVFSLLIPALDMAKGQQTVPWVPVVGGFALGALFLLLLDTFLPHLHQGSATPEGISTRWHRSVMLFLAITLHNIPEGMAVGMMFGLSGAENGMTLSAAVSLALGIGLQNIPEGAAIALPLKQEGVSSAKAFFFGAVSGIVEPIAGIVAVMIVGTMISIMPWMLSFAAGAMIYVIAEELIPAANEGNHSNMGTVGVIVGFIVMMFLDIALG